MAASAAALALAAAALLVGDRESALPQPQAAAGSDAPLLLFTSLPIYWGEAADVGSMLGGGAGPHWARTAIEHRRPLHPLDTLDAEALGAGRDLLMIQPRPLSPNENVALDEWVGKGGRVLLFADPALTEDSAFAVGDRRRPQDVVLLSPILGRWGLTLAFDEAQDLGERTVSIGGGGSFPVNLPGRFVSRQGGRDDAICRMAGEAVVAECRIGKGRAVAVADAALFETPDATPGIAVRQGALDALLARTFAG